MGKWWKELNGREERARLISRLEPTIMAFKEACRSSTFHAEDLRDYVIQTTNYYVAPDSPGRALRELRQLGRLNYVVINNRQSLYQFRPVIEEPK